MKTRLEYYKEYPNLGMNNTKRLYTKKINFQLQIK